MPSGNIPDREQKKIIAIKGEDSRDPKFIIENINIIMKQTENVNNSMNEVNENLQ